MVYDLNNLATLKDTLKKEENAGKTVMIAYVYSATDANPQNIGKLPAEIADNTGAYAIPMIRKVKIPEKTFAITTKFVDEKGVEITPSEMITGKKNENFALAYATHRKNIAGYEFAKVEGIENGIFTQNAEIVYHYKKLPETREITIKFIDEKGKAIIASEKITGKDGEVFTVMPKVLDDYDFIKVRDGDTLNGNFSAHITEIRLIYKQKEIIKNGKIIIKYTDEANKEIAPTEEKIGIVGTDYTISQKEIADYDFVNIQ